MRIDDLPTILADQPAFRLKQARQAIFKDLISDWQQNTTLPASCKEKLQEHCPLTITAKILGTEKNRTLKALITLGDGASVESVLLRHQDGRRTVCVSSQVGCSLGCKFCATGQLGCQRSLTAQEILEQVLFFARYLKEQKQLAGLDQPISNVVFMGMGEPFLNYDQVMRAVRMLNDQEGLNIGARHISISTSGIVEGINKLSREDLQVNLAISLHAPNDKLRSKLMPINQKYSLDEVMAAVRRYVDKKDRQVMFEYLLLDQVNDQPQQARELAKLLDHPLYMVNLIRYNPTGSFQPSTPATIKNFKNILQQAGLKTTQRYSFGQDIKAACGQLAGQHQSKDESAD